jgi:hypothetical protein
MHQRLVSSLQSNPATTPAQSGPQPREVSAHSLDSGKHRFAHRLNPEKTFDSICRACFSTIATHSRETDLEQSEQKHVCDPYILERYRVGGILARKAR